MNEIHVYDTKQINLQLENALQFRDSRIKEIEDFFIAEISDGEKITKKFNKYLD